MHGLHYKQIISFTLISSTFYTLQMQEVCIASLRVEKNKLAKDCIVMTWSRQGTPEAWVPDFGVVTSFLTHEIARVPTKMAKVQWFKHTTFSSNLTPALEFFGAQNLWCIDSVCKCPVVSIDFHTRTGENLWPVEKLAPFQLSAVPHPVLPKHFIILAKNHLFLQPPPD